MQTPVILSWSGGKDSALALHQLRASAEYRVVGLVTVVTEAFGRVCMHGVRNSLLEQQAAALGLPLTKVVVPPWPSNVEYERRLGEALEQFRANGVRHIAFGDIFLAELRDYRIALLARHGCECLFPLWGRETRELMDRFSRERFQAITVCIDPAKLDGRFLGQEIGRDFVNRLPQGVDPCGENGEYHTFVYGGPGFSAPVAFERGETVARDAFLFFDLIPSSGAATLHSPETSHDEALHVT